MDASQNQNSTSSTPREASRRPSFLVKCIATGFFSGYAPYAPGTAGSLAGLFFFLLPAFHLPSILIPSTLLMLVAGAHTAGIMESVHGHDPAVVTIDEVVGMWVSLWFVPFQDLTVVLGFFIFRILDIVKPYPARIFDSKRGGWNIMLDDVVAGIYTNIILQVASRIL